MKRIIPLTPRRWLALEIFRRMKHERVEEHPLRQLFWECTLRCNVRCRHCGSDCKSSPATPDMPLQDFLKVLDSIATHTNPHDVFVIISGGEPTVREDLETCGKEISRRVLYVTIRYKIVQRCLLLSHFNEYDLKFDLIARFLVLYFLLKSYFC